MTSPGVTTLGAIRATVRQRGDWVNNQFFTDAELNGFINSSYQELYDLLVQKYGCDYYVQTKYTFPTDGVSDHFALPTDFYKLLGVDLQLTTSPNGNVTLKPFTFADRNRFAFPSYQTWVGRTNLRYRLAGGQVWLAPLPAANQTIGIWYVPRLVLPVNDADTIDGVSGWEEYIVVDTLIKAKVKEEDDVSVELALKKDLILRIESAAENRDAASPATVADVRSVGWGFPGAGFDGEGY